MPAIDDAEGDADEVLVIVYDSSDNYYQYHRYEQIPTYRHIIYLQVHLIRAQKNGWKIPNLSSACVSTGKEQKKCTRPHSRSGTIPI